MIKLIASDMDGTLVASDHHISKENAAAIKHAQGKGVEFIISTGRSFEDARGQVEEAGISCNYLVMNGSELRNHQGEVIRKHYLDNSIVSEIVTDLLARDLFVEVYSTGGTFALGTTEACKWAIAAKIHNFYPDNAVADLVLTVEEHFLYKELNRISDVQQVFNQGHEVGKIICFNHDTNLIAGLREEIPLKYTVNATGSFAINLEITNPLADKGNAIKNYALSKGIDLEDVMTIGDSFNDMTMIDAPFGYTVAMGNAIDEIKSVARYITDTNDQHGVGNIINKILK
ncbi:haloacid dehalogenase [Streptococcus varani]|uniref:Haloacid dehalogenase n=1 Tax=Streptococcus varani TaxID=1608583 RepID=A0A0E3WER4_9STRE|nr:Cof-type HAD-IIB family hydrolase [Streptococcus varani]CQR24156.1 haloacid dehalogenase [Streptococcus varani]